MIGAFTNADIAAGARTAGEKSVLRPIGAHCAGEAGAKQRQRRYAQAGGKMQRAGVAGNKRSWPAETARYKARSGMGCKTYASGGQSFEIIK